MTEFKFNQTVIESHEFYAPQKVLTSEQLEDTLAESLGKMGVPRGSIYKLSGIKERRVTPQEEVPSINATKVAMHALEAAGVESKDIDLVLSCSVARDKFEPATACIIHHNLGCRKDCMAFDITNACIGFSNGIVVAANMIEAGMVKRALVISSENPFRVINNTITRIINGGESASEMTRKEFLSLFPVVTLGSGAAAFVLTREDLVKAKNKPKILGGVAYSDTSHINLCSANTDFCTNELINLEPLMFTEASAIIEASEVLGKIAWERLQELFPQFSLKSIKAFFPHQVGKHANGQYFQNVGLDNAKEYRIYEKYGNMVSTSLPASLVLGSQDLGFKAGDRAITFGFGSGLNGVLLALEWQ